MYRNLLPIAVLIVLTFSALGRGQDLDARIEGTVEDENGAVVPGVTVIAKNVGTGESRKTDGRVGEYERGCMRSTFGDASDLILNFISGLKKFFISARRLLYNARVNYPLMRDIHTQPAIG